MPTHEFDNAWLRNNFPDYEQLKPLASGGQKQVFSGLHKEDGEVVLKLLLQGSCYERFNREVDAGKIFVSKRVPKILASGSANSPVGKIFWLREQRIIGENLRAKIQNQTHLSFSQVTTIGLHCLEVLSEAEEKRIIHRDIKPENIFIQRSDNSTWVLDFGIARHLDRDTLTRLTAQFGLGTIGYMAPEQLRNLQTQIDIRADLFSLGVTLYESIERSNPFLDGARDELEVIQRIEKIQLPPISREFDPDGELTNLILALSRKERNHRISTASEAFNWMQDIHR